MDFTGIGKSISELGFGAVAMGAVLFAAWKLLNWGKGIVDNAMAQLERERDRSAEVYNKLSHAIDEHTTQAKEFHNEVRTAHGYQREEHNKLIDGMTSMCGEIKRCSENTQKEHERMITNLDEQAKVLLRINGEKH
jgi:hypothetical protein